MLKARAMAKVSHPNVVAVHEVGSVGGRDFIAMELVDGTTVSDWQRAAPRSTDELLTTFVAAGHGLVAALDGFYSHFRFEFWVIIFSLHNEIVSYLFLYFNRSDSTLSTCPVSGGNYTL